MTMTPGSAIRSLRTKLGMTLLDVSKRAGLAISTLSKLENGTVSLSFEKLEMLSKGMGVPLAELLGTIAEERQATPQIAGRRSIQLAGDGLVIESGTYSHTFLAVELLRKRFIPVYVEVHCRTLDEFLATAGELIRHDGEEFNYVLEGEIELYTELYTPVRLKQGESVYFDSSMKHAYLAACDGPCRMLNISTGPDDALMELTRETAAKTISKVKAAPKRTAALKVKPSPQTETASTPVAVPRRRSPSKK